MLALFAATVLLIVRSFKAMSFRSLNYLEQPVIYRGQRCFEASVKKVANGEEIWLSSGKRVVIQGVDSPKGKDVFLAVRELERLVLGRRVTICPCETSPEDSHKRLRAQVFISNESVAEHLLKKCVVGLHYFAKCDSKIADELYRSYLESWQSGLNMCKDKRVIQAEDAAKHIGSFVIVEGTITNSRTASYPLMFVMQGLKIVIFRDDLNRLKSSGITPENWGAGTKLKVFGQISDYNGPEIILRSAHQILEVEDEN